MEEKERHSATSAVTKIIEILNDLADDERRRVLSAILIFFGIKEPEDRAQRVADRPRRPDFSDDLAPSPKEFVLQKQPRTDVERIACLAYYLTHYREMPHFKTLDIAKLNTEAAQPKFSNAAYSAKNAMTMGYLAPATKGQRQLSAAGEQFVQALPDRDAAKAAMANARPRRPSHRKAAGKLLETENP